MLKNISNSLFGIFVLIFVNLFCLGAAEAVDRNAMPFGSAAGCDRAETIWLEPGEALDFEPGPEGAWLHVAERGFLLAESYALDSWSEPQLWVHGVQRSGADWLAGRLLSVEPGTYCLQITSQSSRKSLGRARLSLAFAGLETVRPLKNETTGDEVPEEPVDGVLSRVESLLADSSLVPFASFPAGQGPVGQERTETTGDEVPEEPVDGVLGLHQPTLPVSGMASSETTGDEVPEEPVDGVLAMYGGSMPPTGMASSETTGDEVPEEPVDGVLALYGGGMPATGMASSETTGDEVPEEPVDGVLAMGGVEVAQVDLASVAARLGLCNLGRNLGSFACAGGLGMNRPVVGASDGMGPQVSSYTFQVDRRSMITLMTEGQADWWAIYDQSGRLVDLDDEPSNEAWGRSLAAGRYLVRIGHGMQQGAYSLAVADLGL